MNDLIFVTLFGATMVAVYGYVILCDRIVERDRPAGRAPSRPDDVAAESVDRRVEVVAS